MDDGGPSPRRPVDVVPDGSDELDEGLSGLWDAVVGPHRVVKLSDQVTEAQLLLLKHMTTDQLTLGQTS